VRFPGAKPEGAGAWSGMDRDLVVGVGRFALPHWRALALSLSLLPLTAALQLVQPELIKRAIDGPIASGDLAGLAPLALVLLGAMLAQYLAQFAQAYSSQLAGQAIVHDLRVAVHRHLLTLHQRFFRQEPAGRLLTRCTGDVEGIGEMFAAGILTLVADLVLMVGICGALLRLNLRLALITFVVLPLLWAVSRWFQAGLRRTYRELRARVSVLNAYLQERISGIRIIQLFAQEQRAYAGTTS
jgi:ATP-binding cassette subfamily B multidrug efflux pump